MFAGLPAAAARDVLKLYSGRDCSASFAETALARHGIETPPAEVIAALAAAGFLKAVDGDQDWWTTTISGNALGMASFGKPITRKTADRLLTELIQRARDYNANPAKPMYVGSLTVFGSYLDDTVDPLGDLDVGLSYASRSRDPAVHRAYARASGRRFSGYIDELFYPERDLVLTLRNRSAAISLTTEDLARITDQTRVVYSIETDPGAIPPPAAAPAAER